MLLTVLISSNDEIQLVKYLSWLYASRIRQHFISQNLSKYSNEPSRRGGFRKQKLVEESRNKKWEGSWLILSGFPWQGRNKMQENNWLVSFRLLQVTFCVCVRIKAERTSLPCQLKPAYLGKLALLLSDPDFSGTQEKIAGFQFRYTEL